MQFLPFKRFKIRKKWNNETRELKLLDGKFSVYNLLEKVEYLLAAFGSQGESRGKLGRSENTQTIGAY